MIIKDSAKDKRLLGELGIKVLVRCLEGRALEGLRGISQVSAQVRSLRHTQRSRPLHSCPVVLIGALCVTQCSTEVFSSCYGPDYVFKSINDIHPVIFNIMVQARAGSILTQVEISIGGKLCINLLFLLEAV